MKIAALLSLVVLVVACAMTIPQRETQAVPEPNQASLENLQQCIGDLATDIREMRGRMADGESVTEELASLRSQVADVESRFVSTSAEVQSFESCEEELASLEKRLVDLESTASAYAALEARVAALESKGVVSSSSSCSGTTSTSCGGSAYPKTTTPTVRYFQSQPVSRTYSTAPTRCRYDSAGRLICR